MSALEKSTLPYVQEYFAKALPMPESWQIVGRFWGIMNRDGLKRWRQIEVLRLRGCVWRKLRRAVEAWRKRQRFHPVTPNRGVTVFVRDHTVERMRR